MAMVAEAMGIGKHFVLFLEMDGKDDRYWDFY